ncbi:MAG: hypothetical protein Q7J78_05535, partial [Clostridiales bacterium]|nr:hypothetical protein [Clostridiales bacterium]
MNEKVIFEGITDRGKPDIPLSPKATEEGSLDPALEFILPPDMEPVPWEERFDGLVAAQDRNRRMEGSQEHARFEIERPQMLHSTVWWAEKIDHEQDELYVVTSNEPTRRQRLEMLDESADIMLALVGFWRSMGVGPGLATKIVLQKLEEIEVRYPTYMFDYTNGKT